MKHVSIRCIVFLLLALQLLGWFGVAHLKHDKLEGKITRNPYIIFGHLPCRNKGWSGFYEADEYKILINNQCTKLNLLISMRVLLVLMIVCQLPRKLSSGQLTGEGEIAPIRTPFCWTSVVLVMTKKASLNAKILNSEKANSIQENVHSAVVLVRLSRNLWRRGWSIMLLYEVTVPWDRMSEPGNQG